MESVSSNYPGYFSQDSGDGDKHAYAATLTAHAAASVERNQDSQFSAGRDLGIAREVVAGTKDARIESLANRYEITVQVKDSEIRALERHNELNEKLARLEASATAREISQLRAEAQRSQFDAQGAVLAQLLEVVKSLATK